MAEAGSTMLLFGVASCFMVLIIILIMNSMANTLLFHVV